MTIQLLRKQAQSVGTAHLFQESKQHVGVSAALTLFQYSAAITQCAENEIRHPRCRDLLSCCQPICWFSRSISASPASLMRCSGAAFGSRHPSSLHIRLPRIRTHSRQLPLAICHPFQPCRPPRSRMVGSRPSARSTERRRGA